MIAGQNVIVTGGAGFIGSHLVDRLVAAGLNVAVLDNLSSGKEVNLNKAAALHRIDVRSPDLRGVIALIKPHTIFHTAAQISVAVSARDPAMDADVNIMGSLNVMEAARAAGVKKVVFVSTGGAMYGEPEQMPARESLPPRPLSPYGASKLAFENYLPVYHHLHGIEYAVVRPANVYGPRQDPHGEAGVVAIFTMAMLQGKHCKVFGDGTDERDYVFVGDVVDLLAKAGAGNGKGPYNGGTGVGTSVNTMFSKLAGLTGYRQRPEYASQRPGDLRRMSLDSSKARQELGWRPQVSLDEGLRRTVEWFKSHSESAPVRS